MKKYLYLAGMLALLTSTSCSKEEEPTPAPAAFSFNEENYTIKKGFVLDIGPTSSHYNYFLEMVNNGDFTFADWQQTDKNLTFYIGLGLLSPGTDQFRTGTFVIPGDGEMLSTGKHYLNEGGIWTDSNGDGVLNSSDTYHHFDFGKATVSGTPHEYTVNVDITTTTGLVLKGSYSGSFEYHDQTTGERAPDGSL